MSDSESFPCPTCSLALTMQLVRDGAFYWGCPNGHWWKQDTTGWQAVDKPEGV